MSDTHSNDPKPAIDLPAQKWHRCAPRPRFAAWKARYSAWIERLRCGDNSGRIKVCATGSTAAHQQCIYVIASHLSQLGIGEKNGAEHKAAGRARGRERYNKQNFHENQPPQE
jgi:hypothetical protein